MNFYGTLASGAGWIVPKKYLEAVGSEGFKKHPIGLGPYKFVSSTPGIDLIMEANEDYWRKTPSVKRLVYKSVPEATTRREPPTYRNREINCATSEHPPSRAAFKALLRAGSARR